MIDQPTSIPPIAHLRRSGWSVSQNDHPRILASGSSKQPLENAMINRAFFALGAASLLNWNAMITATPFFITRLEGSAYQTTFTSYLSLTFNVMNLVALTYATLSAKQNATVSRIRPSIIALALCLLLLLAAPLFPTSPSIFFFFSLGNSVVQAFVGGLLITSIIALASLFGPSSVQAASAGQAAIGVLISVVEVTSAALSLAAPKHSSISEQEEESRRAGATAVIFFGVSSSLLLVALAIHSWLVRQPAYTQAVPAGDAAEYTELTTEEHGDSSDDEEHGLGDDKSVADLEVVTPLSERDLDIWHVSRLNIFYNSAIALTFFITLSLFPPITALIQSTHPPPAVGTVSIYSPTLFNAIHFLVFNGGDYLGRALLAWPMFTIWSGPSLLGISFARILFVPLFLICNVQLAPLSISNFVPSTAPISSDLAYMVILLFFGITNGHTATLCMMAAASPDHNRGIRTEQVELAATIAQFWLSGGIALGSLASFAVRGAVCKCNPFVE